MNYITVKLTEDQALYLAGVLNMETGYIQNGASVAFNKRLGTKFDKALAKAKTV